MSERPEAWIEREIESYDEGIMRELYGNYFARSDEYAFAVDRVFHLGVFRGPPVSTPVLAVGCRDPYDGMLKYLRSLRWDGKYVGLDIDPPESAVELMLRDNDADTVQIDLEGADLPFPPTDEHMVKLFAVAFCIEVIGHIGKEHRDYLVKEMQRVAGSVFIIEANAEFTGLHPDFPYHKDELSTEQLEGWGFQHTGYTNFNGRDPETDEFYSRDNGESATSSEVWGVWSDHVAARRFRPPLKTPRVFEMGLNKETKEVEERGDRSAAPRIVKEKRQR